jgi:hypothetical protein
VQVMACATTLDKAQLQSAFRKVYKLALVLTISYRRLAGLSVLCRELGTVCPSHSVPHLQQRTLHSEVAVRCRCVDCACARTWRTLTGTLSSAQRCSGARGAMFQDVAGSNRTWSLRRTVHCCMMYEVEGMSRDASRTVHAFQTKVDPDRN